MDFIFGAAELGIAMDIGERLLICGAEVSRVEDTIERICMGLGIPLARFFEEGG